MWPVYSTRLTVSMTLRTGTLLRISDGQSNAFTTSSGGIADIARLASVDLYSGSLVKTTYRKKCEPGLGNSDFVEARAALKSSR